MAEASIGRAQECSAKVEASLADPEDDPDVIEGLEDLVLQLDEALAIGDVGVRTPLGQILAVWIKASPEKQQEYRDLKADGGKQKMT